jgi:type IV pilus assembly protein PilC
MQFVCRVGTPEGRVLEEVRQARDETSLRRELERIGYHIFDVRRRGLLRWDRLGTFAAGAKRVSPQILLVFNRELAALLRAGLPLLQALDLVVSRQREGDFRTALVEIRDRVESGESLSDAVAAQGEMFPPLYAPTLLAGERSGELEDVIDRFARYQQLVYDARKQVTSALIYPAVLIGLSLVLIAVMLLYVVPGFEGFFETLDTELPLVTRLIMALSHGLTSYWAWWVGALVVAALALVRLTSTVRGSVWLDRAKLRVPFLGKVLQRFGLGEFCRSLSTLLAGGTPLVQAIGVSAGAVGNGHLRERLSPVAGRVSEGATLYGTLEKTEVFPDIAIDMVQVGEATGELARMLATISDFFDDEVETSLQRMLSLIEPLMLVFMGVVISTLLISVYLPLSSALSTVR